MPVWTDPESCLVISTDVVEEEVCRDCDGTLTLVPDCDHALAEVACPDDSCPAVPYCPRCRRYG